MALIFQEADTDGDGVIAREEFVQWHVKHKGGQPSAAEWAKFNHADADGDGSLSHEELVLLFKDGAEPAVEEPPAKPAKPELNRDVTPAVGAAKVASRKPVRSTSSAKKKKSGGWLSCAAPKFCQAAAPGGSNGASMHSGAP